MTPFRDMDRAIARRIKLCGLGIILGVAVLMGAAGGLGAAWAQDEIFVANTDANSLTVYARTASGNTAPSRTLSGGATGLNAPKGVVVDLVNDELIVANATTHSITVYARTASGNTPPLRTLSGGATGLNSPRGVAVDLVHDELIVANRSNNSVTVYSRTAAGNTAPLRTLSGSATGMDGIYSLAVDTVNNELIVADSDVNTVLVFSRTASGNTAPLRLLSGSAPGFDFPDVALDLFHNELVVINSGNIPSVMTFSRTATGNTPPLRTLSGPATGLTEGAKAVVVDLVHDELLTVNEGCCSAPVPSLMTFSRTATGNTPPLRTLSGPATGLANSQFFAVTTPPAATASLNGATFHAGSTVSYQATLLPGPSPSKVDIYLGCLLPDGVTFLSLVQPSPGVTSVTLGQSPMPFQTNVLLTPTVIPFSYPFTGAEPTGTYFTFAGLAVAGSNPFLPSNQLSLSIQAFQFTP